MKVSTLTFFALIFILLLHQGHCDLPLVIPENILIVANIQNKDSIELAEFYREKRHIPKENIIYLGKDSEQNTVSSKAALEQEVITWNEFIDSIYNPLLKELIQKGWIQGLSHRANKKNGNQIENDDSKILENLFHRRDSLGRIYLDTQNDPESNRHSIGFIVLCKGIPLKIKESTDYASKSTFFPDQKNLHVNQGSVDSKLTLLCLASDLLFENIVGPVPNPLFFQYSGNHLNYVEKMIRVARLDGPSLEATKLLIENSILAEKKGLQGKAYFDLIGPERVETREAGNTWLEETIHIIEKMGFETVINHGFEVSSFWDAPALYFGWYSRNVTKNFLDEHFAFAPGAIGFHIHSFSAETIQTEHSNWVGPLIAKGITATFGNVYEPFLGLSEHPHILMSMLKKNPDLTIGEAAYLGTPALGWQTIFVGDPLYRPFRYSLDEQIAAIDRGEETPYSQYAIIRKMNLIAEDCGRTESLAFGIKYLAQLKEVHSCTLTEKIKQLQSNQ